MMHPTDGSMIWNFSNPVGRSRTRAAAGIIILVPRLQVSLLAMHRSDQMLRVTMDLACHDLLDVPPGRSAVQKMLPTLRILISTWSYTTELTSVLSFRLGMPHVPGDDRSPSSLFGSQTKG